MFENDSPVAGGNRDHREQLGTLLQAAPALLRCLPGDDKLGHDLYTIEGREAVEGR